jgi:hypothetical protein
VKDYLVLLPSLSVAAPPAAFASPSNESPLREFRSALNEFMSQGKSEGKGQIAMRTHLARVGEQLGIAEMKEVLHQNFEAGERTTVNKEALAHLKGAMDGFEKDFDKGIVSAMDGEALGYLKGVVDGLEKSLENSGARGGMGGVRAPKEGLRGDTRLIREDGEAPLRGLAPSKRV